MNAPSSKGRNQQQTLARKKWSNEELNFFINQESIGKIEDERGFVNT